MLASYTQNRFAWPANSLIRGESVPALAPVRAERAMRRAFVILKNTQSRRLFATTAIAFPILVQDRAVSKMPALGLHGRG